MPTSASGPVPPSLVQRLEEVLRETAGDATDAGTQLIAAEACLRAALEQGSDRAAALDLLAADALLTSACGAAVQAGSTSVEVLAADAAERLTRILNGESDG